MCHNKKTAFKNPKTDFPVDTGRTRAENKSPACSTACYRSNSPGVVGRSSGETITEGERNRPGNLHLSRYLLKITNRGKKRNPRQLWSIRPAPGPCSPARGLPLVGRTPEHHLINKHKAPVPQPFRFNRQHLRSPFQVCGLQPAPFLNRNRLGIRPALLSAL